jgi:hypothetical protein
MNRTKSIYELEIERREKNQRRAELLEIGIIVTLTVTFLAVILIAVFA